MIHIDWNERIPSRPESGHYLAQITRVTDNPEKQYLRVEFDIADGDFRDCAKNSYPCRQEGTWPRWAVLYISYKLTSLRRFKAFRSHLEASNRGANFVWDSSVFDDLTRLHGLRFGVVYGEKTWEWNGTTGTHCMPLKTEAAPELDQLADAAPEVAPEAAPDLEDLILPF